MWQFNELVNSLLCLILIIIYNYLYINNKTGGYSVGYCRLSYNPCIYRFHEIHTYYENKFKVQPDVIHFIEEGWLCRWLQRGHWIFHIGDRSRRHFLKLFMGHTKLSGSNLRKNDRRYLYYDCRVFYSKEHYCG